MSPDILSEGMFSIMQLSNLQIIRPHFMSRVPPRCDGALHRYTESKRDRPELGSYIRGSMVKKGLSLEEKRGKILNIYHGTKSIFSLKEIEKAATKQGVVSQTVKVSGKWLQLSVLRLQAKLQLQTMTMSHRGALHPAI